MRNGWAWEIKVEGSWGVYSGRSWGIFGNSGLIDGRRRVGGVAHFDLRDGRGSQGPRGGLNETERVEVVELCVELLLHHDVEPQLNESKARAHAARCSH